MTKESNNDIQANEKEVVSNSAKMKKKSKTSSKQISNVNKNVSHHAVGKRKSSVVKVWISLSDIGKGLVKVNNKTFTEFFGIRALYTKKLHTPFEICALDIRNYDIKISTIGGGLTGCIDSISLAISRALIVMNSSFSELLKNQKLLTRDARVVESKKYGLRKARKKEQYSKR